MILAKKGSCDRRSPGEVCRTGRDGTGPGRYLNDPRPKPKQEPSPRSTDVRQDERDETRGERGTGAGGSTLWAPCNSNSPS